MITNIALLEAKDDIKYYDEVLKSFKAELNTLALSKYKNEGKMFDFFSAFFNTNIDKHSDDMKYSDWLNLYIDLLTDSKYYEKIGYFLYYYVPTDYSFIFSSLDRKFYEEVDTTKKKATFYNQNISKLNKIHTHFEALLNTITPYSGGQAHIVKFKHIILTKLDSLIQVNKNKLQEIDSIKVDTNKEMSHNNNGSMNEDSDLLFLRSFLDDNTILNENILTDAIKKGKDNAKDVSNKVKVTLDKFEKAFDRKITEKIKDAQKKRTARKHSEMVGESLRISNELKRIMKFLPLALLSPAIAAVSWLASVAMDKKTDLRDRDIIMKDIALEIKLIDEKITHAERNNDDKGKIQLMRAKDKMERELDRIRKNRLY